MEVRAQFNGGSSDVVGLIALLALLKSCPTERVAEFS